jgi:hypothetical protein
LSAHNEAENGINGVAVGIGVDDATIVGVDVAVGCIVSFEVGINVGATISTGEGVIAADRPGNEQP